MTRFIKFSSPLAQRRIIISDEELKLLADEWIIRVRISSGARPDIRDAIEGAFEIGGRVCMRQTGITTNYDSMQDGGKPFSVFIYHFGYEFDDDQRAVEFMLKHGESLS
jgi:hypothetical protein